MPENKILVPIQVDYSGLSDPDLENLKGLLKINPLIDALYEKQVSESASGHFYPKDLSKEEFTKYLENHTEQRERLEDNYTIVRRDGEKLIAIDFSEAYKEDLTNISKILIDVSDKTNSLEFKEFLSAKVESFSTNDFAKSDVHWVKLNSGPIELILGPEEEYEDNIWAVKRSFESVIGVVLREENEKLQKYQDLAFEYDSELSRLYGSTASNPVKTMVIIDVVSLGGYSKIGFIPMACNLPNDTWFKQKYGSKQVFNRNIMYSKFNTITRKIADKVVDKETSNLFTAEDYVLSIVGHELAHGLGIYCKNGLRELGHSLEEAKADVFGCLFLYWLSDKGVIPKETAYGATVSKIVDGLRQIRFGQKEAHALGAIIQYRWHIENKGISIKNNKIIIDEQKIRKSEQLLGGAFAELALSGDYEKAKNFILKWGREIEEFNPIIKNLHDIPLDIIPDFEKVP